MRLLFSEFFADKKGAWIAVNSPSSVGYGGGVPLSDFTEYPSTFEPDSEGFVVAVMHQMHCIVSIFTRPLV